MPLQSMVHILRQAQVEGYGVGIFCGHSLENFVAIVEAAVEERSPIIMATGGSSHRALAGLIRGLAEDAPVPIAIELDHGRDFVAVMEAIRAGYTDVMIDASALSYEGNVNMTRKVVEAAHAAGVGVEAEIGHVGLMSDTSATTHAGLTEPAEAVRFVADSGCDVLAVAVGTAHGMGQTKREPKLDFVRLRQIRDAVSVPLVLHGGSGVSDDDFRTAIANGISKINIYTALALAATKAIRMAVADPKMTYHQLGVITRDAIKAETIHHMRVFGSSGKAQPYKTYWTLDGESPTTKITVE